MQHFRSLTDLFLNIILLSTNEITRDSNRSNNVPTVSYS